MIPCLCRFLLPTVVPMIAIFLACTSAQVSGQGPGENKALIDLQQRFNTAYAKLQEPLTELDTFYANGLQRLFKDETSAGNLDSAVQVKAEIAAFGAGGKFEAEAFEKRSTQNQGLEGLRRKYLAARERVQNLSKEGRATLLGQFRTELEKLERQQTQAQKLELALATKKVREDLASNPRFQDLVAGGADEIESKLTGRLHFIAKGEIEIRHNGDRMSYRDDAENVDRDGNVNTDERRTYVEGESRPRDFQIGDILVIRMRSDVTYRTMIMALVSEDGSAAIPFTAKDYRYLGEDADEKDFDRDKLLGIVDHASKSSGDALMISMWDKRKISSDAKNSSEWVKIGASDKWHCYAVMLREEMLLKLK